MQPRWDDIQSFLQIAQAGQMARAATITGINATTIARHLRRLEATLGRTLFEQTREGQVLTEAGERLLASAEAMQAAAAEIAVEAPGERRLSGTLRVSVSEGFGTWFVAHFLPSFADQHPDLSIDLAATTGLLNPSKRETDVAVMLARPQRGPVVASKLTDYRLGLYAARAHLDAHGPIDSIAELRRRRLVGYIPDLLYSPELRYLAEIDAQLGPTLRSSSINAQYRLVASGSGVGVLPRFIGDADAGLVRVLPGRTIDRSFWIVTHRDTQRLQRVKAFRAWLIATVREQRHRFVDG